VYRTDNAFDVSAAAWKAQRQRRRVRRRLKLNGFIGISTHRVFVVLSEGEGEGGAKCFAVRYETMARFAFRQPWFSPSYLSVRGPCSAGGRDDCKLRVYFRSGGFGAISYWFLIAYHYANTRPAARSRWIASLSGEENRVLELSRSADRSDPSVPLPSFPLSDEQRFALRDAGVVIPVAPVLSRSVTA
jgi:hypothetical protein